MDRLRIGLILALALRAGSARGMEDAADWRELITPHFHLYTDLAERDARRSLQDFETAYAALAQVGFALGELPALTTDLVLFRSGHEFASLAPKERLAPFFTDDRHLPEPRPTVVMPTGLDLLSREISQHELTHRLVHRFIPEPPLWLTEGLAELFSTLYLEKGQVILGEQPSRYRFVAGAPAGSFIHGLVVSRLPSVAELLAAGPEKFHGPQPERERYFYAGSWVLMHLLFMGPQGYRPKFVAYFSALAEGRLREEAWRATLGTIGMKRLEKEYRRYVVRDTTNIIKERYTPPPPPVATVRALPEAEVRLLWATLRSWDPGNKEQYAAVRADLARAQALAPDAPAVRSLMARFAGTSPGTSAGPTADTGITPTQDMRSGLSSGENVGQPAVVGQPASSDDATLQSGLRMLSQLTMICHDRHPEVEGDMTVDVVIDTSGKVSGIETHGPLAGTPAGRCLEQLAAKIKFTPFDGAPMRATFPIVFRK